MKRSFLLVFLVIFVAGCTSIPFLPGSDVLNIQNVITTENPKDVIVIENAQISPASKGNTVFPDQNVDLLFNLVNKDDVKTALTSTDIFNAPLFRDSAGQLCNQIGCKPVDQAGVEYCTGTSKCSILPGEEKQISVEMKTPRETDIAGIITKTAIDFKANYDFVGALVYTMPAVNLEEIRARQRGNEKTEIQFSKAQSSGPVKIDVSLVGPTYVLAGQPAILVFKIKNVGSGTVFNSKIDTAKEVQIEQEIISISSIGDILDRFLKGQGLQEVVFHGMTIKFPQDTQVVEWPGCNADRTTGICTMPDGNSEEKGFNCALNNDGTTDCFNVEPIELFRDESRTSLRFKVNTNVPEGVPFKSFTIRAYVGYNYELRKSIEVTVNPFYNVG